MDDEKTTRSISRKFESTEPWGSSTITLEARFRDSMLSSAKLTRDLEVRKRQMVQAGHSVATIEFEPTTKAEMRRVMRPANSADTTKDPSQAQRPASEEVLAYFAENFGTVSTRPVLQVDLGHPVTVYAIEPQGDRKHLTLFTAGLSSKEMTVPQGQDDYALAELFIELPGDWSYRNLADLSAAWPVVWLSKTAQYPHENETWLGGFATIIANEDPPQPLAPNIRFTSLLLLAEKDFVRSDGRTVQVYRVSPLYTAERELEIQQGIPALLRAFDRQNVPFIVDLHRKSVSP